MSATAQALVGRLIAAGEWPEPQLLQAILDAGEEAVPPLLEVLRKPGEGPAAEATLCYAVCLLGSIGAPEAIPDLVGLFRQYDNETLQDVASSLSLFGPAAVEPALEVVRDPGVSGRARDEAATAAILAAGNDAALRGLVADTLRGRLADCVARAGSLTDEQTEEATMLVVDLTNLADPQARELIASAFRAGIVDTMIIRPEDVEHFFRQGGAAVPRPDPRDWLQEYEDVYLEEMEARRLETTCE
jgi:HEAT repeat protein